ncbi:hypothetical protein D030_2775A, partial [Vibrio parahaemolyticus AQ3810]
MRGLVSQRTD